MDNTQRDMAVGAPHGILVKIYLSNGTTLTVCAKEFFVSYDSKKITGLRWASIDGEEALQFVDISQIIAITSKNIKVLRL